MEHIWASVGYIIHITSLIEYNLINLIAGDTYLQVFDKDSFNLEDIKSAAKSSNDVLHDLSNSKSMLGKLIGILKKNHPIFDESFLNDLSKVSDIRGYYAHQFFKEDLWNRYLETNPYKYRKKLREDVGFVLMIHYQVLDIDRRFRELAKKSFLNKTN